METNCVVMAGSYDKREAEARKMVAKRIEFLISQAGFVCKKELPLANRYVTIARNMSMKFNVKIPGGLKTRFCKHCYSFLVPGQNCRVRTQKGKVVYTCKSCDRFMRFPFTKERKIRRRRS